MALPTHPNSIGIDNLRSEFATSGQQNLGNFYAGGQVVPAGTLGYPLGVSTPIPSSGQLRLGNFHGASGPSTTYAINVQKTTQDLTSHRGMGFSASCSDDGLTIAIGQDPYPADTDGFNAVTGGAATYLGPKVRVYKKEYKPYSQTSTTSYSDVRLSAICSSSAKIYQPDWFPATGTSWKITTTAGAASLTSISVPTNLNNYGGLQSRTSGTANNGYYTLSLPWTITYNGTNYTSLSVGTNSYITFGGGSSITFPTVSSPAFNKILISSADSIIENLWARTDPNTTSPNRMFNIRFQGYVTSGYTQFFYTLQWELRFYENDPSSIEVHIIKNDSVTSTTTYTTVYAGWYLTLLQELSTEQTTYPSYNGTTESGYGFGRQIAMSSDGNTIAICHEGKLADTNSGEGAVYIFTRASSTQSYTRTGYIITSNSNRRNFASAIALAKDGNTLFVSSTYDVTIGPTSSTPQGEVYVYTRNGNSWSLTQTLTEAGEFSWFGSALEVSYNGNTLVVSAPGNPSTGISCKIYIFNKISGTWYYQTILTNTAGDYWGYPNINWNKCMALSSDGNTLALGQTNLFSEDYYRTGNSYAGTVTIYTRSDNTWSYQSTLNNTEDPSGSNATKPDGFGLMLTFVPGFNNNLLIIAAPLGDVGYTYITDLSGGNVYTWKKSGNTYSQFQKIRAQRLVLSSSNVISNDANVQDRFGKGLATSYLGQSLVIGAPINDSTYVGGSARTTTTGSGVVGSFYVYSTS